MTSLVLLASLLLVSQTAENYIVGGREDDAIHPLAGAFYPSLPTDSIRGGVSGSVGGALNNGGAWASLPRGAASVGLHRMPFLGDHAAQLLAQETGRNLRIVPKTPIALWAPFEWSRWSVGLSGHYGDREETSSLAQEEFDRTRSESGAVTLGLGRSFGSKRFDLALTYGRMRVHDRKGSVLGEPEVTRLEYPLLGDISVRGVAPAWQGTMITRMGLRLGKGHRNDETSEHWGYDSGATWVRLLDPLPGELRLGARLHGWEGDVMRHQLSLRQSVAIFPWRPHALVFTAIESMRLETGGFSLNRTFRLGYQYTLSYFQLTLAADVERFPGVVVVGAEIFL